MIVPALDAAAATPEFLALIPREFAREHTLLSQGRTDAGEVLAIGPATSAFAIHNVGVRLGRAVAVTTHDPEHIAHAIDAAYEQDAATSDAGSSDAYGITAEIGDEDIDTLLERADRDLLSTAGKAPLIKLMDRLLFQAVQLGASDLHVQPLADQVVIRHRIDGVLDEGRPVPTKLLKPLCSRIKVMGRMDVAEHLVPQDGRATVVIGERTIDLRISTLPTAYGERIVLRLLDSTNQLCDFPRLGMPEPIARPFLDAARRSSGIILVTGPTGSGKTTTLYATLRQLNSRERNIMTIEDPIEYELNALGTPISQSQINLKKGVTFANGLRHILRQDPDVIMVGEIRDAETARIAIQSSLTGHLVFSTLHTNDAVSAVTRLIDLGIEPYLVTASLSAVLAQRLVRTLCRTCAGTGTGAGGPCSICSGSGYKGRVGVFELLVLTDALREVINSGGSLDRLREVALASGMRTLGDEGRALIAAKRTTAVEIERVIHS